MKKQLYIIGALIMAAAIILFTLNATMDKPNRHKNGFIRNFRQGHIMKLGEKQYSLKLDEVAGMTDDAVFFRTNDPGFIAEYTNDLSSMKTHGIALDNNNPKLKQAWRTEVDSSLISIFAFNVPSVYRSNLNAFKDVSSQALGTSLFTDIVEYQKNRFIIRAWNKQKFDFEFRKIDSVGDIVETEKGISIPSNGRLIGTQGVLLYSKDYNLLFYVYRLFNKVQCFDTNLNLIYSATTIDTVTNPFLETAQYVQNTNLVKTYGGPPSFTNYRACVAGNFLYINSLLKADNQNTDDNTAVIDVYALSDGAYRYSFQLAGGHGKLGEFKVRDSTLIALYKHQKYIAAFRL